MTLSLGLWILTAATALIALAVAVPPLPRFRMQYRFSARVRHRLRHHVQVSTRLLFWTVGLSLVVACAGAAMTSALKPANSTYEEASQTSDTADGAALEHLVNYARSIGPEAPKSTQERLPDVNTMIERLASRLETAPNDIRGWRMLGWSYFNTGAYTQAAGAYAKAAELDPKSDEIRRLLVEAQTRASETAAVEVQRPATER